MKYLLALFCLLLATVVIAQLLVPASQRQTMPVGSVASEVCQDNGTVVGVVKQDGLLYVSCSSGIVQLLKP